MSEIRKSDGIRTQITTVKLPPDNQDEMVDLIIECVRFMATQPGFVFVNLHRSRTALTSPITCNGPTRNGLPQLGRRPSFPKMAAFRRACA